MDSHGRHRVVSMNPHPIRAYGPGRVNLIGEHTDYNDGLCMPFAIERGVTVTAELHGGAEVVAPDLGGRSLPSGRRRRAAGAGVELPGCTLSVAATCPRAPGSRPRRLCAWRFARPLRGRGRGAAAAAEAGAAVLEDRERVGGPGDRPARPARFAARRGRARVRLDMRTLEARSIELDLRGHVLVTLDSGASRSLAARATTSAARSAGVRSSCSGWSRCATPRTAPACPFRSTAACGT